MEKQKGFTLVELVVVIIILGILAVTAAPKFINMQSDAYASTLKGMQGAINGANVMVYAKAALQGKVTLDGTAGAGESIKLSENKTVQAAFGYTLPTKTDLEAVLDVIFDDDSVTDGKNEWIIKDISVNEEIEMSQRNAPNNCKLTYKVATALSAAKTTLTTTGC